MRPLTAPPPPTDARPVVVHSRPLPADVVRADRRELPSRIPTVIGVIGLVALLVAAVVVGGVPAGADTLAVDVRLADSGRTIADLVAIVEAAAATVEVERPIDELTVVLTDQIPGTDVDPVVGGLNVGDTVWVRMEGVALPSRTLIHEVAHAFTPGGGHGEPFREVYLAAVREVYGSPVASRERRRLAWVYDRCYLDESCPRIDRQERGGA